MGVELRDWRPRSGDVIAGRLTDSGEMGVLVSVPQAARFGNVAYSDHDKAVLVSFVVILPAAVLDAAGDLMGLFDIDLDTGTSFSTQLVAVHDLGED